MKKISLVLVMLIAISGVASASGIDNPKTTSDVAIMKRGSTFQLFYKGAVPGKVTVRIRDAKGDVVFTESIRKMENFSRPYNFSSLKEGEYAIEVTDASGTRIEKVSYYKGELQKLAALVRVTGKDDKYMLLVPNRGEDTITVKIFDQNNTLVYNQHETITGDFARVYNMAGVSGKFTIKITGKDGISRSITNP